MNRVLVYKLFQNYNKCYNIKIKKTIDKIIFNYCIYILILYIYLSSYLLLFFINFNN